VVLTLLGVIAAAPASAGVITSGGGYQVGIGSLGNLYDGGVGFRRPDGYDPIQPGTPREAWGVSAGAAAGTADPFFAGTSNITANSAVFGAGSASISTFLNNGADILRIDQAYNFAADNVLRIDTTVTNVSGSSQAVRFARHVDWDILPSQFFENSSVPAPAGLVSAASCGGFENPNPLVAFGYSCSIPGTTGPGDLGGALVMNLGTLTNGEAFSFSVFHAISQTGQSSADLAAQLAGLGSTYTITGYGVGDTYSAALGVAPVPEPGSLILLGSGIVGLVARRRRQNQA